MSYTKTVWEDLPSTNTPITAENLNNMEDGIETNDKKLSGEEVIGDIVVDSIRTKNLFDKSTTFQGFIETSSSTIFFDNPPQDRYSGFAKVKPNTTYTISKQAGHSFRIATTTDYPISGTSYNTTQANHTGTSITITTGANDNYIVVFYYAASNGDTGGQTAMASTIQVEEGPTVTTYSAYQNLDGMGKEIIMATATPNSSYISTVQVNRVTKCGKIVTVDFRGLVSANIPNNTTIITLPYHFVAQGAAPAYLGGAYDYASTLWCSWGNNGNVFRAGQGFTSASGKYVHIHLVYITND